MNTESGKGQEDLEKTALKFNPLSKTFSVDSVVPSSNMARIRIDIIDFIRENNNQATSEEIKDKIKGKSDSIGKAPP